MKVRNRGMEGWRNRDRAKGRDIDEEKRWREENLKLY